MAVSKLREDVRNSPTEAVSYVPETAEEAVSYGAEVGDEIDKGAVFKLGEELRIGDWGPVPAEDSLADSVPSKE